MRRAGIGAACVNRFNQADGATYDADGNLTNDGTDHVYTWDADGHPVTLDSDNLVYDALGREVEVLKSGAYTEFVFGPTGKLALMNGQTQTKAFVPLPGGTQVKYAGSAISTYRLPDWLGSFRVGSNPNRTYSWGVAFAPFGEMYAQSGGPAWSFTGEEGTADTVSDEYDFLARKLHSAQGRWISPDQLGLEGADLTNPQSWNRYSYVLNEPLLAIDPFGLFCVWDNGSYDSNDDPDTGSQAQCEGNGPNGGGTWFNGSPSDWDPNAGDWSGQESGEFSAWASGINPNGVGTDWMNNGTPIDVNGGSAPQIDLITGSVTPPATPCTSRNGRPYGPGHFARDYHLPSYGTSIPAPENGSVTAGRSNASHIPGPYNYSQLAAPGTTNFVQFVAGSGYSITYVHVHPSVGFGEPVSQGSPIGVSDNSGRITGPHTHVQVTNPSGARIDPNMYFTGCQ